MPKSKPEASVVLPPDDAKISVRQDNPKRGKSAVRYECYKHATTLEEYYSLGGSRADAKFDIARGHVTVLTQGTPGNYAKPQKTRKKKSSSSSSEGTLPKNVNGYTIFVKDQKKLMKREGRLGQTDMKTLTKLIPQKWRSLTSQQKKEYDRRAMEQNRRRGAGSEHEREMQANRLGLPPNASWERIRKVSAAISTGDTESSRSKRKSSVSKDSTTSSTKVSSASVVATKRKKLKGTISSSPTNAGTMSKKLKKTGGLAVEWTNAWKPNLRIAAIRKGLDYIFGLVNGETERQRAFFSDHGGDVIQCFNDIARSSGEPVRRRALMYCEQLSARWRDYINTKGWKIRIEPTPAEVIEAISSVYSLECRKFTHIFKGEIIHFCLNISSFCASDYFGWDVGSGPPPAGGVAEICSECGKGNVREAKKCAHCGSPVVVITRQRALSNALVHLYFCMRVGVSLGATFPDAVQWIPDLRPYKGAHQLEWREYMDQCYLVSHIIFTMSEWGELQLDPRLFPHEFFFILEHLSLHIRLRNVHIVGEFVECLRIFGIKDDDPTMRRGIRFLLRSQDTDGSWDGRRETDAYTLYHATMVGVQALLPASFRGFGPGEPSIAKELVRWHSLDEDMATHQSISGGLEDRLWAMEKSLNAAIRVLPVFFPAFDTAKKKKEKKTFQEDPATRQNIIVAKKRLKIFLGKRDPSARAIERAGQDLKNLSKYRVGSNVTVDTLINSGVLDVVKTLAKKCTEGSIKAMSKSLRGAWKKQFTESQK